VKGLNISLTKYPFLAIHAKGGESISPKQKDRTTTNFKIFKRRFVISTKDFQLVSYFRKKSFNLYLIFDIFQNGMTSFKINI
jgi:hypothetical protein